jgi:hypothetical protein
MKRTTYRLTRTQLEDAIARWNDSGLLREEIAATAAVLVTGGLSGGEYRRLHRKIHRLATLLGWTYDRTYRQAIGEGRRIAAQD